jgi:putative tricarboxylic transport membrane protein
LNKHAVHLPFSNVAERPAKYGSSADLLLLSTVQLRFICLNLPVIGCSQFPSRSREQLQAASSHRMMPPRRSETANVNRPRLTGPEEDFMKHLVATAVIAGALLLPATAFAADYSIMAPAAPGGGWDQTARSMQEALTTEGISGNVQVVNVPGAGGTIGLAQFSQEANGDPSRLMVGGYVMVGAILTNKAPVTLDAVTPIARLTGEYEVIVVPAASELKTLADLTEKLKADPGSVSWAGGSAGGTDHITAGLFAKTVGVDPKLVNYIAFSGGGEALAAVLGNQVTVGISGYGEFQSQVEAGALRVIGVSAPEKVSIIDGPTFKEGGVDLVVQNWRGVWAGPGLSDEQVTAITGDIEKMVNSESWKKTLETKGWMNTWLAGNEFKTQLAAEQAATAAILKEVGLVQ